MKLSTYVIGQGDTIEILSQQLLSGIDQADTLIQINNLRYPYISDDPADQYGNEKGNVFLSQSYTNPSSITVNNKDSIVILPNDTIYFSEGNSNSSGVVQSISGSTIIFQNAISGTFDSGAVVTVYANQQNITTQVLRTGDTLFYPFDSSTQITPNDYSLAFSTDWQLDDNGYLIKSNRDIGTVSGVDNLTQAFKERFRTHKGGLLLHPDYGNGQYDILGEAGESYFFSLAKFYAQECAFQDPRIDNVQISSFSINQDQIYMNLSVTPKGSQTAINQPITIPLGGIG